MTVYWCGFNGFKQIAGNSNSIALGFLQISLGDIKDISFAWDCAIILSACDVYISGFCGSDLSCLKKISKPNEDIQFSKVSCGENYALLTTQDGDCWQFFYSPPKWKQLLNFCSVEETECSSFEEVRSINAGSGTHNEEKKADIKCKRTILKSCCGGILNVALDNLGVCFSIPSPITLPGIRVTDIACGFEHCLILDEFGRVFSWGSGMRGQLGYNVLETSDCPVEVDTLSGLQVTSIAAGGWHSAAVTYSGILFTWGWNNSGQLGFPTLESSDSVSTTSSDCEEGGNIENVATKRDIVRLQRDDPDLNTFSKIRSFKRFKLGNTRKIEIEKDHIAHERLEKNFDLKVSGTEEMRDDCIDAKSHISLKVPSRELDISNLERSSSQRSFVSVLAVPKAVSFPCEEDVSVTDVSCGNRHTVLLTGDGSVWGCGWNAYSQLGESPNVFTSSDCVIKLNIKSDKQKICKILCGGWNTAVFFEEGGGKEERTLHAE